MYQTARSRRETVALSGPAILSAVPRESQRKIEGIHRRSGEGRICAEIGHLWHGPFRVAEKINEFSVKLEIAGTGYQIFLVVHVSKLKLVKDFPDRPRVELTVNEADRLDFDEILLPEDSWVPDLGADEYEVERISDVRSGKKTRFGRIYREFLVHWAGYDEPTWVDEADPNCRAILNAFLRERANRNRFNVMQSHEEIRLTLADPAGEMREEHISNRLIPVLEGCVATGKRPIPIFSNLGELLEGPISIGGDLRQGGVGKCEIFQRAIPVRLVQTSRACKGRFSSVIWSRLGKAGRDPVVGGESGGGFGSRVVGLALQNADLLLQVPDLVAGLSCFLAQTISIRLGMVKTFAGGNRVTLEVVTFGTKLENLDAETFRIVTSVVGEGRDLGLKAGDLVSLAVLEHFHVPDVGS
ncbi:hypothetical protein PHMEG_00027964 [Phytophthora megakarya]|uniref:Chromo domain-containing protein n=1 Tax=Phytophthora megakarya TaxID=4795 RepID=A0A225V605_9STRA|nr:hypothetical protein PHMEG_00027964 [Phytophthora megakarya]